MLCADGHAVEHRADLVSPDSEGLPSFRGFAARAFSIQQSAVVSWDHTNQKRSDRRPGWPL